MSNNIQESILIELREDDSIKSTTEKNGEYTIHLQEPLTQRHLTEMIILFYQ